ncbi:sensor histidine kinase [Duganella qianjiadongensis]|uniref:Histidine kinase n=1 Tax=Duganella qianjiadongensis TaxID=2692176 RepID=A0ABW9VGN8_9BURK|nr:sensor histidine kinase [Duganella qianjiadongensis]MYM38788.1 histidine kinase [Duganella qianjiadongensis]
MSKAVLACGAGLLALTPLQAATPASPLLSDYTHTAWNGLNGAPIDVHKIAQTSDGWLWAATPAGLFRFDGVHFERMDRIQGQALRSNNVMGLLAPPDGSLWVGYRLGGVSVFGPQGVRHFGPAQGLPDSSVWSIAQGPDGTVWVATSASMASLAPGAAQFTTPDQTSGLAHTLVRQILFDRAGVQWVSAQGGVYFRAPGASRYTQAWPRLDLMAMAQGPDGSMWACDGLSKCYRMSMTAPAGNAAPRAEVEGNGMHFDRAGGMWTLRFHALNRHLQAGSGAVPAAQQLTKESGLSGPLPQTFFQDREGNIWIGTSNGIDRLRRNRLQVMPVAVPFDQPMMVSAGNGEMLISDSAAPLRRYRPDGSAQFELAAHFDSAYRDGQGAIWLGNGAGLWRREGPARYSRTPMPPELAGFPVQAMVHDEVQRMWVSVGRKGLYRIEHGQWRKHGGLAGLLDDMAMCLVRDGAGRVWVGYLRNQLAMIQGRTVQLFGPVQGLALGNVLALLVDGDHLWLGGETGLAVLDLQRKPLQFQPVHLAGSAAGSGLRGISGIVRTSAGELWLHGANGITRIAAADVVRLLAQPEQPVPAEQFNALDGLPGLPGQFRPLNTVQADSAGRLWFSTASEVASLDPRQIVRNALVPSVQITSVRAGGLDYPASPAVQLPQNQRDVRFSFTALSLSMPERVAFRYQLQGYDKEWQDPQGRREAFYTNLPPGSYRFIVKAANEDGVWNEQGADVWLNIAPAFTETPLFYLLLAAAALVLLYIFYLLRVRYLTAHMQDLMHERLAERARIARGLHDTLLQSVQGLIMYFDSQARRLPSDSAERAKLEQTLDLADQLMVEGREHIMDLRSEAIPDQLEQSLQQYGRVLLHEHFTMRVLGKPRVLCDAVRNEVHAIAREALLNAARHAKASMVVLEIDYQREYFIVRVSDNGLGLPCHIAEAGQRAGHWGLVGMRERAVAMGAQFQLESAAGQGTRIELRLGMTLATAQPARAPDASAAPSRWWRRLLRGGVAGK